MYTHAHVIQIKIATGILLFFRKYVCTYSDALKRVCFPGLVRHRVREMGKGDLVSAYIHLPTFPLAFPASLSPPPAAFPSLIHFTLFKAPLLTTTMDMRSCQWDCVARATLTFIFSTFENVLNG